LEIACPKALFPRVKNFRRSGSFSSELDGFDQGVDGNSEIVYQQAMEGQPVPELIAENKALVAQVEAIEPEQQEPCSRRSIPGLAGPPWPVGKQFQNSSAE
jgi:hypothetical protein